LINQAKEKIKEENNKRKEAHEILTRMYSSTFFYLFNQVNAHQKLINVDLTK